MSIIRGGKKLNQYSDHDLSLLISSVIKRIKLPTDHIEEIEERAQSWGWGRSRLMVRRAACYYDTLESAFTTVSHYPPSEETRMWSDYEIGTIYHHTPEIDIDQLIQQ